MTGATARGVRTRAEGKREVLNRKTDVVRFALRFEKLQLDEIFRCNDFRERLTNAAHKLPRPRPPVFSS